MAKTEIEIDQILPGSANQLIGSNAAATKNEYKTLSGTSNQITVTNSVGTYTLSTPLTSSISYTLPSSRGSNGQVLTTDGSTAILTWTPVSSITAYREDYVVGTALNNYTGSTTVFNLVNAYTVGGHSLIVTLDGDIQTVGSTIDYLETNSTTVTFNNTLVVGQKVSFIFQTATSSGGIVNSGTAGQVAYYPASTAAVSSLSNIALSGSTLSIGGNPLLLLGGSVPTQIATITTSGIAMNNSATINMNSAKITSLANGTASTDAAAFGQLKVLQTVYAQFGGSTTTTSSTSFVATSNTATITPTSSSSRILIITASTFEFDSTATSESYATIFRGSTNLAIAGSGNAFFRYSKSPPGASEILRVGCTVTCIDSPATTSATTYTVEIASPESVSITYGSGMATIILMEIV